MKAVKALNVDLESVYVTSMFIQLHTCIQDKFIQTTQCQAHGITWRNNQIQSLDVEYTNNVNSGVFVDKRVFIFI